MSVTLTSKMGARTGASAETSNGTWKALCAMGTAFGVPGAVWNGCHDNTEYNADTLSQLADRAKQIGQCEGWLRDLAACGGATLS